MRKSHQPLFALSRICILVSNDITHDPRVKKQIKSASNAGFKVLALGYVYPDPSNSVKSIEKSRSILIKRGTYIYSNKIFKYINSIIKLVAYYPYLIIYFIITPRQSVKRLSKLFFRIRIALIRFNPRFYNFIIQIMPESLLNKLRTSKSSVIEKPAMINSGLSKNIHNNHYYKKFSIIGIYRKNKYILYLKNKIRRLLRFILNLSFYWEMTKYLSRTGINYKPDIVHANDLDTLLAGYLIKRKTGAKLIYDAHEIWTKQGLLLPTKILVMFSFLEKHLIKKIDAFISVNESIIKEISKIYHYKFKVPTIVVYNCPTYKTIKYKTHRGIMRILYQGRYCFDRGLEELAESTRFIKKPAKIYFRALGDPATKEKISQIIKRYKLEKKVILLDPVPMEDMVEAAKDFDIGVIPYIPTNINNKLCTPNKLFEYMSGGLSLAVSDLPELNRIIRKNKNGLNFNPRSPRSIAKTLNKLLENRQNIEEMRKNSLEAAKIYCWENEEKKLIGLYNEIVKTKN